MEQIRRIKHDWEWNIKRGLQRVQELELDQKYFNLHSDQQRSLLDMVMKSASFTNREELPDRTTFIFSKISLLRGVTTNLQHVTANSVTK